MSNKYTYKVPFTEKELFDCYVVKQMSQTEIAKIFGTTQKVVWRAMLKTGIKARIAKKRDQLRDHNSSWKGGRVLVAKKKNKRGTLSSFCNGYYYLLDPGHPNANKSGYVAEHIAVATKQRKRPLQKGEHVHHINLNKHDNRPENLIIGFRKQHAEWHNQLEELAISLMHDGYIVFDRNSGYVRIR